MTEVDSPPHEPAMGPARRAPLRQIGQLVDARIAALQERYRRNASAGVSDLAALRRAVTEEPGADPRVWELTLAGVPVEPGAGDEPTDVERAVHAAMTLYAIHQQSQPDRMHRPGYGLGRSVRGLVKPDKSNEKAVRRRFETLGTAATFAELMQHSRGLVRQLRSAAIPLDYGQLADDLVALQSPTGADGVRLRWGRDYHRGCPANQTDETDTAPTEPEENP
jgi:CRISPR system Cascade subunit CasB